jgi:hypothetical protein
VPDRSRRNAADHPRLDAEHVERMSGPGRRPERASEQNPGLRAVPTVTEGTADRTRFAITVSIDQRSVAARIIHSPEPNSIRPRPERAAWPATRMAIATTCAGPIRSRSSVTASSATQTTRVLWMKAASPDEARVSPSKKRGNGKLPPITEMAARLSQRPRTTAGSRTRNPPHLAAATPTTSRTRAAVAFLKVV